MRNHPSSLPAALAAGLAVAGPSSAQDAPGFCQTGFAWGETSAATLSMRDVEALRTREFAVLDADGDGRVTLEDYRACVGQATEGEILSRNVSTTGSGDLTDGGLRMELDPLVEERALSRADYMAEAERAYDATGNAADNQLEWARVFILLLPGEEERDVREIGRDAYAARAAALFGRLDADGNGELTPKEWMGEGRPGGAVQADAAFGALDRDGSGEVTAEEYALAGAERAQAARVAALAAGWEDHGDHKAGIGTEGQPGEVVSTSSEGLVEEGDEPPPAAEGAASPPPPRPRPSDDGERVPVFYYFFQK
jgi:Ca2+-binding EF-hand superfamily protein